MKRHICFLLSLLLLATLTSCWLLEEPFGTEAPTAPPVSPATEGSTQAATTPYEPSVRTVYGTVVANPGDESIENLLTVSASGGSERFCFFTEEASGFCRGDQVEVVFDENAEPVGSCDGEPIRSVIRIQPEMEAVDEKPVIYLYPEAPTEVSVRLTLDGKLSCTYPAYGDGWKNFVAYPDGTLRFRDGREYYCLYWEGVQNMHADFSRGFCVRGADTAAFLEWALEAQGLTPREANEFIIYWLPRMEPNPYNVIAFQTDTYTDTAVLDVTPAPDSLLRVFMAYYPSEEAVELAPQTFSGFDRTGFTVVEWGGCACREAGR